MKDYAKGRVWHDETGEGVLIEPNYRHSLGSVTVAAAIRQACAEAIRDTQRRERKRAVRIVRRWYTTGIPTLEDLFSRVLGTRRKK